MGLKKLTAFILPRDVREHILGDLEEAGFTWRNLASVLPRIWWRHFWNPYLPSFAGATEEDFHKRVLDLQGGNRFLMLVVPAVFILANLVGLAKGQDHVADLAFGLIWFWFSFQANKRKHSPAFIPRDETLTWREYYRQSLEQVRFLGRGLIVLATLVAIGADLVLLDPSFRSAWKLVLGTSLFAYTWIVGASIRQLRWIKRVLRAEYLRES